MACGEGAGFFVEVEDGDGIAHFVDDVEVPVVGMEVEVAWTLTWFGAAGFLLGQLAGLVIDGIDLDLVESEVGSKSVSVVGRDEKRMGMRLFLPGRVHRGALVLGEIAGRA